jgi:hypothetical protein
MSAVEPPSTTPPLDVLRQITRCHNQSVIEQALAHLFVKDARGNALPFGCHVPRRTVPATFFSSNVTMIAVWLDFECPWKAADSAFVQLDLALHRACVHALVHAFGERAPATRQPLIVALQTRAKVVLQQGNYFSFVTRVKTLLARILMDPG